MYMYAYMYIFYVFVWVRVCTCMNMFIYVRIYVNRFPGTRREWQVRGHGVCSISHKLQCVAVCCSVLQCVAVCCRVHSKHMHSCSRKDKNRQWKALWHKIFVATNIVAFIVSHIRHKTVGAGGTNRWCGGRIYRCVSYSTNTNGAGAQIGFCRIWAVPPHVGAWAHITFFDGYCSTVQGLLDWFEVDLGFT